ncbi:hypothetical protein HX878_29590 [Pseudomonas veronii]|nr:hypothetical protein [Pseudomonas veronii]
MVVLFFLWFERIKAHEDLACRTLIVTDPLSFHPIRACPIEDVHSASDRDPRQVMNQRKRKYRRTSLRRGEGGPQFVA